MSELGGQTILTISKLEDFSGSYQLKKGNKEQCPDGEFTGRKNSLVIGATMRVSDINKGVQKEKMPARSACTSEENASFDGKALLYSLKESCPKGVTGASTIKIASYQIGSLQYISFKLQKKTKLPGRPETKTSFACLYSKVNP